jgi:predicted nucleic acid-binding protein
MLKLKTVILDSSVWVAYFHKHDLHHEEAINLIKNYDKYEFLIPEIVYFETLTKIFRLTRSLKLLIAVQNQFQFGRDIKIVKIDRLILDRLFLENITKVSLKSSDFQILLYTVEHFEAKFETFDNKLLKAYTNLHNYD